MHKNGSRRREFMVHGVLQQMPVKAIDVSLSFGKAKLQFRRPATAVTNPAEPWNPSCTVSEVFIFATYPLN